MRSKKIDKSKLSGIDLFHYYTTDHEDKEYASVIELLPIACGSMEKAIEVLVECEKGNKKLVAFYPEFSNEDVSEMRYIGEITDGAIYVK
jgi:hypothetical protein